MLKRLAPGLLVILISSLTLQTAVRVSAQTDQGAQHTERIRAEVAAIGAGARVSLKLRGKKKQTGYVNHVGANDFVLTGEKGNGDQRIAYSDVAQIERSEKSRLATRAKIGLGVIGVLFLLSLFGNRGFGG